MCHTLVLSHGRHGKLVLSHGSQGRLVLSHGKQSRLVLSHGRQGRLVLSHGRYIGETRYCSCLAFSFFFNSSINTYHSVHFIIKGRNSPSGASEIKKYVLLEKFIFGFDFRMYCVVCLAQMYYV